MKLIQLTTLAASLFASGAFSHSWVACIDTIVPNKAELEKNPSSMSNDKETCKGYPRGLPSRPTGSVHSPDWIWESSNYVYDLENPEVDDKGKAYACRALQRKSTTDLPITKAKPGETILIRYYGNGHSTSNPMYANPQGRDPGVVRVYWAGAPNKEIVYAEDLNEGKWIKGAQQAFEKGAIIEYKESRTGVTITKEGDPNKGQKQKDWKEWANYMAFTIPKDIQTGRHMMVWTWAWSYSHNFKGGDAGPKDGSKYNNNFKNSYSTCFDIEIEGGAKSDAVAASAEAQAKTYDPSKNDICTESCKIGGFGEMCDPKTKKCPSCRVTNSNGGVDCYEECTGVFKSGTTCPAKQSAKFRRSIHAHNAHARRHMF